MPSPCASLPPRILSAKRPTNRTQNKRVAPQSTTQVSKRTESHTGQDALNMTMAAEPTEIRTESCVLHPRRRGIRHLRGLHLRNLTLDVSSTHISRSSSPIPAKVRSDTKDMIGLNTPLDRQRYLQSINSFKFLNVFYSLYYDDDECFYVSEVREKCIHADFQEFRLDGFKRSRETRFKLKVWASKSGEDSYQWSLLMDYEIDMKQLLYWGEHLENVHLDGKNSIIVELFDGVYILPIGVDLEWYKSVCTSDSHKMSLESLSFDSLMKLNGLGMGIEDLQISKKKLELKIKDEVEQSESIGHHRVDQLHKCIQRQREINDLRQEKLDELVQLKQQKLKLLQKKKHQKELTKSSFAQMKEEFGTTLVQYENTLQDLVIERSKVLKTVVSIFPKRDIEQWLECKEFEMLPVDLSLKNMTDIMNTTDAEYIHEINAGFGYLCHLIYLLSRYLAVPLRYQVQPFGSSSYVIDNISQINQRKVFPLFYTSHFYRFQYAVMLMNTNIKDILDEAYNY